MQNTFTQDKKFYGLLFGALFIAYFLGLRVPLLEEDASHHANIALHMYLTGDYVSLIDRGMDYLDKPHLHFWLAAWSYSVFGVTTWAYKLPSFLFTILGVYATFGLGKRLYDLQTGRLAALIFASAQAEILAMNDVRMDALLTACIVIAIWQLVDFVYTRRWPNLFLGALFTAAAFCTKGMIGLAMPGVAVFFLLIYQRNWAMLFNWRWLVFAVLFLAFISPVVYCYYLQFDLHPEKVIRGVSGRSGIKFILWNQNTERLEGSKWGKGHKDYFFFFHTMLWAFLPWCLLTYDAYVRRMTALVKNRFAKRAHLELAMPGLITVIFIIISSSGYQLPHYLNILFPAFAILTAANLVEKSQPSQDPKLMRIYLYVQYFVAVVCLIIILVVNIWSFPVQSAVTAVLAAAAFGAMIMVVLREPVVLKKLVALSVLLMVFVNVLLNGNFYPQLVQYQPGYVLSDNETVKNLPQNEVYFYNDHSYCFDFYLGALHADIDVHGIENTLQKKHSVWVFTRQEYLPELTGSGLKVGRMIMAKSYHTTRLTKDFMNPKNRPKTLEAKVLVELTGVDR